MTQLRTVQVLGGGSAGSSAHVRSLTAGLVARGVRVTVCAPAALERDYDFPGAGALFVPVARRGDPAAVGALRTACADADVVHAHGLHAAVRAALALSGRRGVPLVVTWHTRAHAEGARGHVLRLLERRVSRSAAVVLATSSELLDRARGHGARDARLAAVAVPAPRLPSGLAHDKARAELGAVDRPLLMAVGSLVEHRGYDVLLDAARVWRDLDVVPLLVIAGEGRERGALRRRIEAESLPVKLVGRRDDITELLAAADIAVAAQPLGGPLAARPGGAAPGGAAGGHGRGRGAGAGGGRGAARTVRRRGGAGRRGRTPSSGTPRRAARWPMPGAYRRGAGPPRTRPSPKCSPSTTS